MERKEGKEGEKGGLGQGKLEVRKGIKATLGQVWLHTPLIPLLWRQRQRQVGLLVGSQPGLPVSSKSAEAT